MQSGNRTDIDDVPRSAHPHSGQSGSGQLDGGHDVGVDRFLNQRGIQFRQPVDPVPDTCIVDKYVRGKSLDGLAQGREVPNVNRQHFGTSFGRQCIKPFPSAGNRKNGAA